MVRDTQVIGTESRYSKQEVVTPSEAISLLLDLKEEKYKHMSESVRNDTSIYSDDCIRNHSSNLLFEKGSKNIITKKLKGGILLHRNVIYPASPHTRLTFHDSLIVLWIIVLRHMISTSANYITIIGLRTKYEDCKRFSLDETLLLAKGGFICILLGWHDIRPGDFCCW